MVVMRGNLFIVLGLRVLDGMSHRRDAQSCQGAFRFPAFD